MFKRGNATLLESTLLLALMGLVAGAVGGLGVGIATSPKAPAAASAPK